MTGLRDAISKAFDEEEEKIDEIPEPEAAPEPQSVAPEEPEQTPEPEATLPEEKPEKQQKTKAAPTPPQGEKAPASWSPKARELWGKLPNEAQAQIAKREKEITTALQQSAQARTVAKNLNDTLAPFRDGLIAAGVQDPLQAIGTLFRAEASLRVGSQHVKAQTIANMIKQYGVDIGTLDSMLAGEAPADSPYAGIEQLIDQRLAPVQQFLNQQQQASQYQAQQSRQSATQSVEQFSQNAEFLADVRLDMADLIDLAAQRGYEMTLQEAYDKACAVHPEISKVMAQRAEQQRIMKGGQIAKEKKHAAVSIVGRQGGMAPAPNQSLRDSIAAAWDSQMGI